MTSTIKVDTIQDQDGNNIISEAANVITIGASGDSITSVGTFTSFTSTGIDDNATSTAITIDSSENVGIGTASPASNLHVESSTGSALLKATGTDTGATLVLNGNKTSNTAGIGTIQFQNNGDSVGQIRSFRESANDAGGLSFFTQATGGANTERMRITSTGLVGIGTSAPARALDVKSSASAAIRVDGGTDGSHAAFFESAIGGTSHFQFGVVDNSNNFSIYDSQNAATRLTVDSSGNVGIGTTSPSSYYANHLVVDIGSTAQSGITIVADSSNQAMLAFADSTSGDTRYRGYLDYNHSNDSLAFASAGTEAMRIDSSGNFLLGTTSVVNLGLQSIVFDGTTVNGVSLKTTRALTGSNFLTFVNSSGGVAGLINHNGSTTVNYATTSDYRVKENVSYDFDATTRLKQLKPARFNFIEEPNRTVDGFLAHEVQDIIPEAIIGEKDATETKEKVVVNTNGNVIAENIEQADWQNGKIADEDGNTQYPTDSTWEATKVVPIYQGIDQSKIVPLLVKTIQELEARITALETTTP